MIMRISIGAIVGLGVGAAMGYYGQCTSGACPLTANPFRGAVYGGLMGILLAMSLYRSAAPEPRHADGNDVVEHEDNKEEEDPS